MTILFRRQWKSVGFYLCPVSESLPVLRLAAVFSEIVSQPVI